MDVIVAKPGQLTKLDHAVFPHETGDYVLEPDNGPWKITFIPKDGSDQIVTNHANVRDAMYHLVSKGASNFGQGGKS